MKKIVRGGASKSYGLDVAKLAGIPAVIVQRAKSHLDTLENEQASMDKEHMHKEPLAFDFSFQTQVDSRYEKVRTLLDTYDLNNITPLQALQLLSKIKDDLR